ncbi:MAG: hypothetical protein RMI89_12135 [Gloeomargarita sp. SKYBB_i_bin120]|nr:hypothetical protein [Gloeomargarita sp. SKYB120]MDW8179260.1 hypothetical protein [Gloeomargarita sp. SKYBB_i_bin120]
MKRLAITLLLCLSLVSPVWAKPCPRADRHRGEPSSRIYRVVTLPEMGLALKVPSNFHVIRHASGL